MIGIKFYDSSTIVTYYLLSLILLCFCLLRFDNIQNLIVKMDRKDYTPPKSKLLANSTLFGPPGR